MTSTPKQRLFGMTGRSSWLLRQTDPSPSRNIYRKKWCARNHRLTSWFAMYANVKVVSLGRVDRVKSRVTRKYLLCYRQFHCYGPIVGPIVEQIRQVGQWTVFSNHHDSSVMGSPVHHIFSRTKRIPFVQVLSVIRFLLTNLNTLKELLQRREVDTFRCIFRYVISDDQNLNHTVHHHGYFNLLCYKQ